MLLRQLLQRGTGAVSSSSSSTRAAISTSALALSSCGWRSFTTASSPPPQPQQSRPSPRRPFSSSAADSAATAATSMPRASPPASMDQAPPAGPVHTRVLHPTGKGEGEAYGRLPVDVEALAAEGLEARFVVIDLKGKQYKVTKDDVIVSDKIEGLEPGFIFECEEVHLVGTPEYTVVGRPYVQNARVRLQVEEQAKDAKIIVFKKKRRKNYRRKQGFRREVTILRVLEIEE